MEPISGNPSSVEHVYADGLNNYLITATATDEDGTFVVGGEAGALDQTFGLGGKVTTNISEEGNDHAATMAIQPDGKIVVLGHSANSDIRLIRYIADGALDTSFGVNGIVILELGGWMQGRGLAIQSDGRIVVAGMIDSDFVVYRLLEDGSLDGNFGNGGYVITDTGAGDYLSDVVIQDDGKIVVAGTTGNGSNKDFAVLRYNTDGSLDTSFSSDGITTISDRLSPVHRRGRHSAGHADHRQGEGRGGFDRPGDRRDQRVGRGDATGVRPGERRLR